VFWNAQWREGWTTLLTHKPGEAPPFTAFCHHFVWSRIIRRAYPVAHIPIAAFQVSHYPSLVIPTNGRDLQFSPLQPFFVVGGYAPSNLGVVAHLPHLRDV
jgi:hypothetical protein